MKNIKIFKEEFDTNLKEIERAEEVWKAQFPSDYKVFLLQYNGGVPYPNCPTISSENNSELWPVNRFFSIGDVIIQKEHPMTYTLHDIDKEDFERLNLNNEYLLVFALGERGVYIMNLNSEDFGQIYFANYSGGDGIIKVNTNSFSEFINSLDMPKWTEEEYDPDFQLTKHYYSSNKIFQDYLYHTPNNPSLGFNRFKEVFAVLGDIQPPEDGYPNIPQKYVHDKLKLEYLLEQGCKTDGLLRYANNAGIIKYLIVEKGLDINEIYKGRYPLQSYLTSTAKYEIKKKYELIHDLLELGIEMDWSIKGIKVDGSPDLPMIEKLKVLHDEYLQYEIDDKNWWIKNGKPSGHVPFKRSALIEQKLGIVDDK
ncbi:SMI1/KNR4 family protein [Sporocytophaga myxococcoides]|uniref:SMI1/KNR4 family protein n=1 Tax=Sporocytophaga myxococcoides TaxID=153721 RepID=UPI0003FCF879|nr:SMI1/KNR4 family protein [Sporocytophaga myxococcoides]